MVNIKNSDKELDKLCKKGLVNSYPPRYGEEGSYVSQTEKSVYITNKGCDVLNKIKTYTRTIIPKS
jgi:methionine aminopeptidase